MFRYCPSHCSLLHKFTSGYHSDACFGFIFDAKTGTQLLYPVYYEISDKNENIRCYYMLLNVITKVSKGIGMIRRMKKYVPKTTILKVYDAIVLSHFDYCSLVWDNCADYLLDKLQKLQNRAAHVITDKTYDVRSTDVLNELNWKPLKHQFKNKKEIFTCKVRNNAVPESIHEMFSIKDNQRYDLRNNENHHVLNKPQINFLKKSISYSAASVWNDLPNTAKV